MENKAFSETSETSIKDILTLVEKNKLDIEDVVISDITGKYLDNIKANKVDTEELTEFLTSAVKLLSLKVKSLLPTPAQEVWEDEESDFAEQLADHLLEYRTFKEAADLFRNRLEGEQKIYIRNQSLSDYVTTVNSSNSLEGLSLGDLVNALEKVLEKDDLKKADDAFELPRREYRVADKIEEVSLMVSGSGASGIEFGMLFSEGAEKGEIIATFLALLELVRLRRVRIVQENTFGAILIFAVEETQDPNG